MPSSDARISFVGPTVEMLEQLGDKTAARDIARVARVPILAGTARAIRHLDDARQLIEAMPRGEQQQQFLEQIKEKEEIIAKLDAGRPEMFSMMERLFGGFDGGFDDEDDDDDAW